MQNSDGFIFMLPHGIPRFVSDTDDVYDFVFGAWRRAGSTTTSERYFALRSMRENKRPFYRARMIRDEN